MLVFSSQLLHILFHCPSVAFQRFLRKSEMTVIALVPLMCANAHDYFHDTFCITDILQFNCDMLTNAPLCGAFGGWYSPCLMFHHLPALYDLMSGINCLLTTVAIRSSVPLSLLTLELCAHDYDISHFTYMSYICYIYSNTLNHYKMRN